MVAFAGRDAGFAGLGALLAMGMLVLGTFVVALLANFDALLKYVLGVGRPPRDERRREPADIGAVAVETDAGHLRLDTCFVKTRVGAQFAGRNAMAESIEHGPIIGAGAGSDNGHLHGNGRIK